MSRYVLADHVGVVEDSECVYVARLPDGPIMELKGTAALIWRETLTGDIGGIADRVADATGMPPQEVARDVADFVDRLLAHKLVVVDGAGY